MPIAFITSLVNLVALAKLARQAGLEQLAQRIESIPVSIQAPLTSVLPVLIIAVFLAIVPLILALLFKLQGVRSRMRAERMVMTRYYAFIIFNVFITATLSGALVNLFGFAAEIAKNPSLVRLSLFAVKRHSHAAHRWQRS